MIVSQVSLGVAIGLFSIGNEAVPQMNAFINDDIKLCCYLFVGSLVGLVAVCICDCLIPNNSASTCCNRDKVCTFAILFVEADARAFRMWLIYMRN